MQERFDLLQGIQSDEDRLRVAAELEQQTAKFMASTNNTMPTSVVLTKTLIRRLERFKLLHGLYSEEDTLRVAAAYKSQQAANMQSREVPKALSVGANMVVAEPIPSGEKDVAESSKRKRNQIDSAKCFFLNSMFILSSFLPRTTWTMISFSSQKPLASVLFFSFWNPCDVFWHT